MSQPKSLPRGASNSRAASRDCVGFFGSYSILFIVSNFFRILSARLSTFSLSLIALTDTVRNSECIFLILFLNSIKFCSIVLLISTGSKSNRRAFSAQILTSFAYPLRRFSLIVQNAINARSRVPVAPNMNAQSAKYLKTWLLQHWYQGIYSGHGVSFKAWTSIEVNIMTIPTENNNQCSLIDSFMGAL